MRNRVGQANTLVMAAITALLASCGGSDAGTSTVISGDTFTFGGDTTTGGKDVTSDKEVFAGAETDSPADASDVTGTGYPEYFGIPCSDNSQCTDGQTDGYCVDDGSGQKACTITCQVNCPDGYGCQGIQLGGADTTFVCVKKNPTNCKACTKDSDCVNEGARCIPIGKNGGQPDMRCAADCSQGQPCGDDFQCVTQQPADGAGSFQVCMPTSESCICLGTIDGTQQSCSRTQEGVGTCAGVETCNGPDGWTGCTAQEPQLESCNGKDDDCDGKTDESEELNLTSCDRTNTFGTCPGSNVCSGGQEECTAKDPAAEICNGQDDDCDGKTDEDQTDTDNDGTCDTVDTNDDGDGVPDDKDNCPVTKNDDQADTDKDGIGDACDGDCDADGVPDETDNCICLANADQKDLDGDKLGNVCDPDADGDGVEPPVDCNDAEAAAYKGAQEICDGIDNNCNTLIDEGFPDTDGDQLKDCLDLDDDNDGQPDVSDCSPTDPSISTAAIEICDGKDNNCNNQIDEGFPDFDDDGQCDAIDKDLDGDGFDNGIDNCPGAPNADQANNDKDATGDVCDTDDDNDKTIDTLDNCPSIANEDQTDLDGDGKGDACDTDDDGDGKVDGVGSDCNDKDASIYFGAPELCDDKDNNCNASIDEGFPDTDKDLKHDCVDDDDDGDGFPDVLDCAPLNASINPDAKELCDGFDNNCNQQIDEACPPTSVHLIFPSAVVSGKTSSGMSVMVTVGVPGVIGTSAPAGGSGYSVDWGFYYTLP